MDVDVDVDVDVVGVVYMCAVVVVINRCISCVNIVIFCCCYVNLIVFRRG